MGGFCWWRVCYQRGLPSLVLPCCSHPFMLNHINAPKKLCSFVIFYKTIKISYTGDHSTSQCVNIRALIKKKLYKIMRKIDFFKSLSWHKKGLLVLKLRNFVFNQECLFHTVLECRKWQRHTNREGEGHHDIYIQGIVTHIDSTDQEVSWVNIFLDDIAVHPYAAICSCSVPRLLSAPQSQIPGMDTREANLAQRKQEDGKIEAIQHGGSTPKVQDHDKW